MRDENGMPPGAHRQGKHPVQAFDVSVRSPTSQA